MKKISLILFSVFIFVSSLFSEQIDLIRKGNKESPYEAKSAVFSEDILQASVEENELQLIYENISGLLEVQINSVLTGVVITNEIIDTAFYGNHWQANLGHYAPGEYLLVIKCNTGSWYYGFFQIKQ